MDGRRGGTLRELVAYWTDGFDLARFETELAALPHLRATVGVLGIHFLHVPGRGPDPLPRVLTHGWLSSMEMLPVIPLLTDPAGHGATTSRASSSTTGGERRGSAEEPERIRLDERVLRDEVHLPRKP